MSDKASNLRSIAQLILDNAIASATKADYCLVHRRQLGELREALHAETPDELAAVCEEIRNKAQSSVGNYGLGNYVAIHRELLGSMCAILDRRSVKTGCVADSETTWSESTTDLGASK